MSPMCGELSMKTFEEVSAMKNLPTPNYDVVELFANRLEELALTLKALNSYIYDREQSDKDEEALKKIFILYGNTVADWLDVLKRETDEVREEVFEFLTRLGA